MEKVKVNEIAFQQESKSKGLSLPFTVGFLNNRAKELQAIMEVEDGANAGPEEEKLDIYFAHKAHLHNQPPQEELQLKVKEAAIPTVNSLPDQPSKFNSH
jgi:hypothetical protein